MFGVDPQQATAYRLAFLGTPRLRPARSARVVVRTPSEVSISAMPGVIDPGRHLDGLRGRDRGGAAVADADGRPPGPGDAPGADWGVLLTDQTSADGTASFALTPSRSTAYRLRVLHAPGSAPPPAPSPGSWCARAVSLSVRGRSVRAGFSVVGQLRGSGHPLAGRTVTLQSVAQGTTEWVAVASGTTNQRGRVFLVQPRVEGTQYRLVFDGDVRHLPSMSGTVVS